MPIEPVAAASCWARGMASFRGFLLFLLIVALIVLIALLLLKDNLDDQLRRTVEQKLSEMLSQTEVTVALDQAEFKRGQGIRLRGLRLTEAGEPLLEVEELWVRTQAEIWDLVRQKLPIDRIEIQGVKVSARQEPGKRFNWQEIIARLKLPSQTTALRPPAIEVRDCLVACQMSGMAEPVELAVRQVAVVPVADASKLSAKATITSDFFREVGISAEYVMAAQEWKVWGNARRFWLTEEMFQQIPEYLQQDAQVLSSLKARIDFDFEVSGRLPAESAPRFLVIGHVQDGVINDVRLPFPVNDLRAAFQADNTGIKFENVVAESLLGQLHLNFQSNGLSTESPFELVAKVDPLYLDQRLAEKLPREATEFLKKFSPVGDVRLNSKLSFQNGRWVPDIVVDLLDVSFAFHKFPYPLTNATGRIKLDDEKVVIDVVAFASGQRVTMKGEFLDPGPESHGQLEVEMEGAIPIDGKVMAAMREMPDIESMTRKFHPRGYFGFRGLVRRVLNAQGGIDELFRHEVSVQKAEFKYDLVPIPFADVEGSIVITETATSFIGFRGKNVNSMNLAQGSWDPVNGLNLTVDSYDVELNESLKSALPRPAIEFWDQVRPAGTLQAVRSQIGSRPGKPIEFVIQIDHRNDNHHLSLNPVWFPYELKDIKLDVSFRPESFRIARLKGHHRKTSVTVSGHGKFSPNGWECHLERLNFDRLVADREFTSALPRPLGDAVESFDVRGMFNVGGRMSFWGGPPNANSSSENPPLRTTWDLTADIDRGYLMCGVPLEDIYGAVRLTGQSQGSDFESLGGMEIDSLVWNGVQFKKVRSPIFLDNNEALLGLWATAKRPDSPPQPLNGVLFGGTLAANARFSLHGNQPFQIQATLNDGDLQEFTFELAPSYDKVVGKGFAGAWITGDKTGTHSLRGQGEIRLVDAKISEVPIMLSMLKLLSVKQLDRTLFNESHINFELKGEHLYFENLEFLGDAISIKGNGEMDFDQQIDLQFYTAVGRDGFRIPVLSPVLGVASQQILVIDVKGTTSNPKVKKNFFKLLNGKLQDNLEDLEDSIDEGGEMIRQATERPFGAVFR